MRSLSSASLVIITQRLSFVKNFFQVLSNFSAGHLNRSFVESLLIIACHFLFVKNFFKFSQAFMTLFLGRSFEAARHILSDVTSNVNCFFGVKLHKQSLCFFGNFCSKKPDVFRHPAAAAYWVIQRPQSGRSRHRYACRQLRMRRCCPHRGTQRSCAPADSSAKLPHRASSASC